MLLYCIKSDKHGFFVEGCWYTITKCGYSPDDYECMYETWSTPIVMYKDRLPEFFDLNCSQKIKPKLYLVK